MRRGCAKVSTSRHHLHVTAVGFIEHIYDCCAPAVTRGRSGGGVRAPTAQKGACRWSFFPPSRGDRGGGGAARRHDSLHAVRLPAVINGQLERAQKHWLPGLRGGRSCCLGRSLRRRHRKSATTHLSRNTTPEAIALSGTGDISRMALATISAAVRGGGRCEKVAGKTSSKRSHAQSSNTPHMKTDNRSGV